MEYDVQAELRAAIEEGADRERAETAESEDAAPQEGEYRMSIRATSGRTLEAVDRAAEMWDAVWEASSRGGRLHLPVLAGLRRGSVVARVEAARDDNGTELILRVEDSAYAVNRPAALFLAVGALGGIASVLWPLYPEGLLPFVPLGLVMAIGAWLLVISRLRTAGPEEFLDTVAELAEDGLHPEGDNSPPDPIRP